QADASTTTEPPYQPPAYEPPSYRAPAVLPNEIIIQQGNRGGGVEKQPFRGKCNSCG
ncbi:hypothetical protein CDV36_012828, partial [Fusarium kuroshium]